MREAGVKEKGAKKTIKIVPRATLLLKPSWIRVRAASPNSRFHEIKDILRAQKLHTVCEEASCPNIAECFGKGTATFMILGDVCTRRCPFCDVAHGRPLPPDAGAPAHLADTIEVLVPDFRGRLDRALEILAAAPPDVMNHNLETVPRLYKRARPGGDYKHSLRLLQSFKARYPSVPTK